MSQEGRHLLSQMLVVNAAQASRCPLLAASPAAASSHLRPLPQDPAISCASRLPCYPPPPLTPLLSCAPCTGPPRLCPLTALHCPSLHCRLALPALHSHRTALPPHCIVLPPSCCPLLLPPAVLQRIDIPGIFRHPWFLQELPEGAAIMNAWYLQHAPDLGQVGAGKGARECMVQAGRQAGWQDGWAGRGQAKQQQSGTASLGARTAQVERNLSSYYNCVWCAPPVARAVRGGCGPHAGAGHGSGAAWGAGAGAELCGGCRQRCRRRSAHEIAPHFPLLGSIFSA